jgi:CP family cyanate transporter-like MFS transporter
MSEKLHPLLRVRHTPKGLLILLILAFSMTIRGPISVYGPIAELLAGELKVDFALIGLLSGLPVFCYAIFIPLANIVVGKLGLEKSVVLSMGIIGVGIVVRSLAGFETLFLGTVVIGAGIALGNVIFPLLISREFTNRYVTVIGIVSVGMSVANFSAGALTYPLSEAIGWRWTLASWVIFVFISLYLIFHYRIRAKRGASRKALRKGMNEWISSRSMTGQDSLANATSRNVFKVGITYLLAIIFFCQCAAWNIFTAWLPQIFVSLGQDPTSAGVAAALFQIFGILGALTTAPLLDKIGYQKSFIVISIGWLILPIGLIALPSFWILFIIIAGSAQSMIYNTIFGAINKWSKTPREIRQMSMVVQTFSYALAGFCPIVAGGLFDVLQSWTYILWVCVGLLIVMMVLCFFTAKKYLPFEKIAVEN